MSPANSPKVAVNVLAFQRCCKAEIDDFQIVVAVKHYVAWLEVPVAVPMGVNMMHS